LQCINIFRRSVMKKRFYIPAYGGCSHQDDIMWDIQVQIMLNSIILKHK